MKTLPFGLPIIEVETPSAYLSVEEGDLWTQLVQWDEESAAALGTGTTIRMMDHADISVFTIATHGGSLSLGAAGVYASGSVVPEGVTAGTITFVHVVPGDVEITVTTPPSTWCSGPAELTVLADAPTLGRWICGS